MGVELAKCTPTLGVVSMTWARSSEALMWPNTYGRSLWPLLDGEGGEIAETRNGIVSQILRYEQATGNEVRYLFWLDDDVIVLRGGAIAQLLGVLNETGADIASGVYFTKLAGKMCSPLIYPIKGAGHAQFIPDLCYPVWGHGMGLTLVKTDVYRKMLADLKLPRDRYGNPEWYRTADLTNIQAVSDSAVDTGTTEDLWFLDNAAQVGAKVWIDTSKHAFGFHMEYGYKCGKCGLAFKLPPPALRCIRRDCQGKVRYFERGYPQEQWDSWQAGKPVAWQTPGGQVVWE